MNQKKLRKYLSSARGQLTLLGGVNAGAIVVAIVALTLRTVFFQTYIREKFPELSKPLRLAAQEVANGKNPDSLFDGIAENELQSVYGSWINREIKDERQLVAQGLVEHHSDLLIIRIRTTLIVGSRQQQIRALELLRLLSPADQTASTRKWVRLVQERARRQNDQQVMEAATGTLRELSKNTKLFGDN